MTNGFTPELGRLMDQVKETPRFHHYAYNTEKKYVQCILLYIRFNERCHPKEMCNTEIERFLSHLTINRNDSASTQNRMLNAILFLYSVLSMFLSSFWIFVSNNFWRPKYIG
jgi:Phage integrase, N-terminal SAM-like domain